jgi:adenylate cyclase
VQSASATVQAAARTLDAVTRFAMQLYLAGACSAAVRKFALQAGDAFALMGHTLMQAGIGKAFSESFSLNIEEYAQRDAYRSVIQSGQAAMDAHLKGDSSAAQGMLSSLDEWAGADKKPAIPRVVTFLFTDIVDAAALTQRLGNMHTQRVIKAHDEIVREAIVKNAGKEVQHTGDGMIITFPDPSKALGAAQSIQQKLDAHNKRMPHLSANVRIAINAGEAMEESGTFFGATVKMTAKICDMAKAGQILAPDVIKSYCKTAAHFFKPCGEITVEELKKNRAVYEISWMKSGGMEYGDIGRATG